MRQKTELLSPAGDPLKLKIAIAFGADALYCGVSHFSLRTRSSKEFSIQEFDEGIKYAHSLGKKIYVAANGFPFNTQIKLFENHIAQMRDLNPDAFIVSSVGAVRLVKKIAPNIPIHLSTQANVLNVLDAQVYFDLGVKRIIAAREASLKDLKAIKAAIPDIELEVFVHGSMCFAYSGRCLISSLQTGRVANRGSCANDCRFLYNIYVENPDTKVLMKVEESDKGSYIFNAKDLNLIAYIKEIVESGAIDSIKIEGRTKSGYYAACATRAYRAALNDIENGCFEPSKYEAELNTTKNRGFSDGFLFKRPYEKNGDQNLATSQSDGTHQVVAMIGENGETLRALGTIRIGEELEILAPLNAQITLVDRGDRGIIYKQGDRYFLRFSQIITANDKALEAIHSGNQNPVLLPAPLPPYSFLRKPINAS
ncbi:MAG: U32 family peptidase [Helicobacteraceae bacterium]|jgi:putative protease|nr:U32 family peptidase [Helicobacteraceae bacterium]